MTTGRKRERACMHSASQHVHTGALCVCPCRVVNACCDSQQGRSWHTYDTTVPHASGTTYKVVQRSCVTFRIVCAWACYAMVRSLGEAVSTTTKQMEHRCGLVYVVRAHVLVWHVLKVHAASSVCYERRPSTLPIPSCCHWEDTHMGAVDHSRGVCTADNVCQHWACTPTRTCSPLLCAHRCTLVRAPLSSIPQCTASNVTVTTPTSTCLP
jgi:hypothetical protein